MDHTQELEQLLAQATEAIGQARSADELEQVRVRFLGRSTHSRVSTLPSPTPPFDGVPGSVEKAGSACLR